MDMVVVTYGPDIRLLRHFLASYELYYQDKDKLFVFASESDKDLLNKIHLPANTTILIKEDCYPELQGTPEFSQQLYLKLRAHEVATTEYFCVMDSDFLFIRPTSDQDFWGNGKPIWFYLPWKEDTPPFKWKMSSEAFVGETMDFLYMDEPQWVFKRAVCAKLASTYRLENLLSQNGISEFQVYGWFAHKNFNEEYLFVIPDKKLIIPICAKINQIPPNYQHLDPNCKFEQYKDFNYVIFWSHWDLAEKKMIEFFEESQKHFFGRIVLETDRKPFIPIAKPGLITHENYRKFLGVFSDGWVEDEIRFMVDVSKEGKHSLTLEFTVPGNPNNSLWVLIGDVRTSDSNNLQSFTFRPGSNKIEIQFEPSNRDQLKEIIIRFGPGFKYKNNPDQREFRAIFHAVDLRKE